MPAAATTRSPRRVRGIDAIAFGYVGGATEDAALQRGRQLRIAYRLEVNEYRGVEKLQLNCQHLQS